MLSDRDLWSAVNMVLRQHGERADTYIRHRIVNLEVQGDLDGVRVWKAIHDKLEALGRVAPGPADQVH